MIVFVLTTGQPGIEKAVVLYVISFAYLASAGLLAFSKAVASHFSAPANLPNS